MNSQYKKDVATSLISMACSYLINVMTWTEFKRKVRTTLKMMERKGG